MFSPADVHCTPWTLNRSPMPASPEHWWDSPHPPIISWLCIAEAFERSLLSAYAESPLWVRAALMCASTWSRIEPVVAGGSSGVGLGDWVVLLGVGLTAAFVVALVLAAAGLVVVADGRGGVDAVAAVASSSG